MRSFLLRLLTLLSAFCCSCAPSTERSDQISGTIDLSPDLKSHFSGYEPLFIIARTSEGRMLAQKKVSPVSFPMGFLLGAEDLLESDKSFEGELYLSVFIDRDGRSELSTGDLTGEYSKNPVQVGDKKIEILIDHFH